MLRCELVIENTTGITLSPERVDIRPSLDLFYHPFIAVPAPYQAGTFYPYLDGQWVVHIPQGRWRTGIVNAICPLEHPVDLLR